MKNLDDVYEEYFSILEEYFHGIYIKGADKFRQADYIAKMKQAAQIILLSIDDLHNDILAFWNKHTETVLSSIKHTKKFKATYVGSISPLDGMEFVKRTALYVDSILIEDPISVITSTKNFSTDDSYLIRMIRHVFNLLDLRELFLGQGEFPLLTIFPVFLEQSNIDLIMEGVNERGLRYFEDLMQTHFDNIEDFFDKMAYYKTPNQFKSVIQRPDLLPMLKNEKSYDFIQDVQDSIAKGIKGKNDIPAGIAVGSKIMGQLTGIGLEIFQASNLEAQLVFDSRSFWKMYQWSVLDENRKVAIDDLVINALQLDDFKWLGNIPLEKLTLMRREGELLSIREVLRKNIYSCTHADLEKTAQQALTNMEEALKNHSMEIQKIEKEIKKKYFLDGSMIVGGIVTGLPSFPLSAMSLAGLAFSLYGVIDWVNSISDKKKKKGKAEFGILGLLFEAKQGG